MIHNFFSYIFLMTAVAASAGNVLPEENNKSATTYLLGTGTSGEERLDQMEEAFGSFSQSLLNYLNLPKHPKILSVGCGTGTREIQMAKYWPDARILAIDNSKEQIELAKKRAANFGLKNIEFVEMDAEALSQENQFDLVYARFLLTHLKDPRAILNKMIRASKLGGLIACGETSSSSFYCEPDDKSHRKALQIAEEVGKIIGVDYDIGAKLKDMMTEQGLKIIVEKRDRPDSSNPKVKELFWSTFKEAKPKLLLANFKTQELDDCLNGMKNFAAQEKSKISMTDFFQVVGRKQHLFRSKF